MSNRRYDPRLGRFLEVDPVEGGSANDYDYVSGDPVNGYDLDGRAFCPLGKNPNGSCRGSSPIKGTIQSLTCGSKWTGSCSKQEAPVQAAAKKVDSAIKGTQVGGQVCPVFGCVSASYQGGHVGVGGGVGLVVSIGGGMSFNNAPASSGASRSDHIFGSLGPVGADYSFQNGVRGGGQVHPTAGPSWPSVGGGYVRMWNRNL